MPRQARAKCDSGIYHILARGINRQDIFHDEEDYQRYLETIERMKNDNRFELYGYCLMTNHIHLLIHEKRKGISSVMKRINTSYAWWYNSRYDRVGHVFQDRYKSEGVENDIYLLTVIRYIHNNPVAARIMKEPEEYLWSSCRVYYGEKEYLSGLTNTEFILSMFVDEKNEARKRFKEYMQVESQDKCLDDEIKLRKSDASLIAEIETILNGEPVTVLQSMKKHRRDEMLKKMKAIAGSTQRQIARVTGLSQSIVFKV